MSRKTSLPNYRGISGAPTMAYGFSDLNARGSTLAPQNTTTVLREQEAQAEAEEAPKVVNYVRRLNHNFYTYTPRVTSVVRTLLGPNQNRRYLMVQNNSVVDVFLGFGATATLGGNESVKLPPNAVYTFENGICPNNQVTAICATGATISVVEGVEIV